MGRRYLKRYCDYCGLVMPRGSHSTACSRICFFLAHSDRKTPYGQSGRCWRWTGRKDLDGYGRQSFEGRHLRAHRLSYALHHGLSDCEIASLDILHRCDTPDCCNPLHLFAGTNDDNMQDKVRKNRHTHGEDVHSAKLNESQVVEILRRSTLGESRGSVARDFGIDRSTVRAIANGRIWKHVTRRIATATGRVSL